MTGALVRIAGPRGPRWSRRLAQPLLGTVILAVPLGAIALAVSTFSSATDEKIAVIFLINVVVAVALQIFMGTSGIVSFGHIAFMGIGAYTAALLTTPPTIKLISIPDAPGMLLDASWSFLPATLVAICVTGLLGFITGIPLSRLSSGAAAIATLALLVMVWVLLSNYRSVTLGAQTFYGIPRATTIWTALAFAVVVVFIGRFFRESRVGLTLRASREDELAARTMGVDVHRARLAAWTLSAAAAGGGGSLYAHFVVGLSPNLFLFSITFVILTMVILGGQTISGAVIGAAAVSVISEGLRRVQNDVTVGGHDLVGLTTIGLGVLVVLTMAFRPNGLLGRWEIDELFGRLRPSKEGAEG